jgi:hypothetical protein
MTALQYDLFSKTEDQDFDYLANQVFSIKNECANVRRGIFSRLDVTKKELVEMINKQQKELLLLKDMMISLQDDRRAM